MAALHENLGAAQCEGLFDLVVQFIARDDVGVGVLFRAVEGAEFAIDVADIGVVNVAVDDVGDDLIPAPVVSGGFGQLPSPVRQRSQFLQGQRVKSQRLGLVEALAFPDLLQQVVQRRVVNHSQSLWRCRQKAKGFCPWEGEAPAWLLPNPDQDHRTTGPQDNRTTGPRDHRTAGPQDHKTTGLVSWSVVWWSRGPW